MKAAGKRQVETVETRLFRTSGKIGEKRRVGNINNNNTPLPFPGFNYWQTLSSEYPFDFYGKHSAMLQ